MKSDKLIWVLTDNRAGNNSQTIGVAQKLGLPYQHIEIFYNKFATLPNFLRLDSLIGIDEAHSTKLLPPYPDLLIASGRKLAPIARHIKKIAKIKEHKEVKLVHIMSPTYGFKEFDLIALPEHDHKLKMPNIMNFLLSPHRLNEAFFTEHQIINTHFFDNYQKPLIALLVGGSNKRAKFTRADATKLGRIASEFANSLGGTLLITTSRRTGDEVEETLLKNITCPFYFYDYRSKLPNPYHAILSLAEHIIVTGDSISMCSEAVARGKGAYIYINDELQTTKFRHFYEGLFNNNLAIKLLPGQKPLEFAYNPQMFDSAKAIAEEIKTRGWV